MVRAMDGPLRSVVLIGGVIVLLVVGAAAVAVLAEPGEPRLYPADTPEGTVQRYIQALHSGDIDTAYDYLSASVKRDFSRSEFRDYTWYISNSNQQRRIRVTEVDIDGDRANLTLSIEHFSGSGIDFNRYSYQTRVRLVREAGDWKIDQLLTDVGMSVPIPTLGKG
jgi:hypothetical protein